MSVDLADYVDQARDQVNPPGVNLFPNADDDEWARRLAGGFWDARIQGITALDVFTESDGVITPQTSGGADIGRDLIQLVIVWTAFRAVTNQLTNLKTQVKAQAGPVSFEQQQSAGVLRDALAALKVEKGLILERLGDLGVVETYVTDRLTALDDATVLGFSSWLGAGFGGTGDWSNR